MAPVKLPLAWPNSSLSNREAGRAAMLITTKEPVEPGETSCKARVTSSLPVPVSPDSSTGLRLSLNLWMNRRTRWISGESPTRPKLLQPSVL